MHLLVKGEWNFWSSRPTCLSELMRALLGVSSAASFVPLTSWGASSTQVLCRRHFSIPAEEIPILLDIRLLEVTWQSFVTSCQFSHHMADVEHQVSHREVNNLKLPTPADKPYSNMKRCDLSAGVYSAYNLLHIKDLLGLWHLESHSWKQNYGKMFHTEVTATKYNCKIIKTLYWFSLVYRDDSFF